ncbi:hypothetical protein DEM34_06690 [Spiribacter halobius]|uniref:Uncharacterized protein n=2 Tax=Sediminicurvatus halobius TaxID=2182432 RepID=A0A2U2N477_9GAMM|nr:hypothetical protein DEM34_06690 [Spiribacter halobius]
MRRLNLHDIYTLKSPVDIDDIEKRVPNKLKKKVSEKIAFGGLLPPKSFESFLNIVSSLAPDSSRILSRFSEARYRRIQNLSSQVRATLAEQKEAVATALTIAGIGRDEIYGWDVNDKGTTTSFLDGLEQVRLREDPMVVNDLNSLPGYEAIRHTSHALVVFENTQSKLTVVLANRLPLEKQLGVDLIYYNETFSCFLMVQYKAMEEEGGQAVYRFPNQQLSDEIDRMRLVLSELRKVGPNAEADGFRLSENPFFLKICPRLVFDPDNIGLVKGMYLPLDYWDLLSEHPTTVGPKGGKRLSYNNVRRYFDNTEFVTIASGGWVGTTIAQSKHLESAIRSTLKSGRAVVFAVNIQTDRRHRRNR